MISKLQHYVNNGGLLIGVSAGSILMSKTITIAKFADENQVGLENFQGLALIDFEVKPHWNKWEHKVEDFKTYSKENNADIYTISDGEAIIVEDNTISIYGSINRIKDGKVLDTAPQQCDFKWGEKG